MSRRPEYEKAAGDERRRFAALASYLRACADRVGLRDWTIVLCTGHPASDEAAAAVKPYYGRRYAEFRFRDDIYTRPVHEVRNTVAHELVHCHVERMADVVDALEDPLGWIVHGVVREQFTVALEHTTDALAAVVADLLPDIDWDYVAPTVAEQYRTGDLAYEPFSVDRYESRPDGPEGSG